MIVPPELGAVLYQAETTAAPAPVTLAITTYPRPAELVLLNGWEPVLIGDPLQRMRDELLAAIEVANLTETIEDQETADSVRETISIVNRWTSDLEELSKRLRDPYFKKAKEIKGKTDDLMHPVLVKAGQLEGKLADFEAEKIRIRQRLERQAELEAQQKRHEELERQRKADEERKAQEKADQDRLAKLEAEAAAARSKKAAREAQERLEAEQRKAAEAQALRDQEREQEQLRLQSITAAPVAYQPEKTEGTSSTVGFEFDVTNAREFAEWCWKNGRDEWIREIAFEKRAVKSWLDAQPDKDEIPIVPGLKISRVLGMTVKKAPRAKTLDVATTKVAL